MRPKECKKCQSTHIVKAGFKNLVDRRVQRYRCQECGYYFTNQEKFHHLSKEKIELIHKMYEEKGEQRKIARTLGISLKAVQHHLKKKDATDNGILPREYPETQRDSFVRI